MSPRVSEILHDKTFLVHFIPTVLILIVGLGATIWGYSVAHETLARDRRQIINAIANDIERSVGNRFMLYEEILRSGVGFFAGSENVTRSDWQRYVDTLEIRMRYPGIKGIGVAPIVLESELSTHVGQATSEGIEQYQVVPTSQRDVYSPILYLEPNDTHNQQMLGYDLFNDPIRRQAMEEARDSGRAFYTDKLDPINQVSSDDQANFMVFLPYYRQQLPTDTTDQRRQAIEGFVFVPLHAEDFFNYVFSQSNDIRNVGLRIYANKKDAEHLIYENDNYK
ncbi:hypothetical protein CYG49_02600, partial [Candidatus Saccharibacteria bacterium]